MSKWLKFAAFLLLAIPPVISLSAHGYLGSLSRLLADDFCVAYYARHFGLLRSIWYWYINWSGGYSTSLIDWLLVPITAERISFVTPVILLTWVAATAFGIGLLLPEVTSKLETVAKSTIGGLWIVFGTLLISPDVPQSLYWWTGMRAYTLPLITITIYLVIFALFQRTGERSKYWQFWILASFGIIFIGGGFSETFTPVQLVLFIAVSILFWLRKPDFHNRAFYFLLAGVLGALVSLIVMIAAPGNSNRQAFYPPSPNLLTLSRIALTAYLAFLKEIFTTPEKIMGLVGLIMASFWLGTLTKTKIIGSVWIPLSIFASGFILAFGCFPPAAWGLSEAPPARNLIIPAFFLVVCSLTAGFFVGNLISSRIGLAHLTEIRLSFLIVSIGLLGYSGLINAQNIYFARQAHIVYAQKWETVNQQIINARLSGNTIVHIQSMDSWTTLDKPNDNPKYWLNICYSKYYGIQVLSP